MGGGGETSHTIHRVVFVLGPPCHPIFPIGKIKKDILGTPLSPRKGHPPLTYPHVYRAMDVYTKIFWGHPYPRARGYRPLRIPMGTVQWMFLQRYFGDTPNPAQRATALYVTPWVPCGGCL